MLRFTMLSALALISTFFLTLIHGATIPISGRDIPSLQTRGEAIQGRGPATGNGIKAKDPDFVRWSPIKREIIDEEPLERGRRMTKRNYRQGGDVLNVVADVVVDPLLEAVAIVHLGDGRHHA